MKKIYATLGILAAVAMLAAWARDFGAAPVYADRAAIVLKGEAALEDGTATITLPGWFETQADTGRALSITCKDGYSPITTSAVANGRFTVSVNESGSPTQAFYWVLIADRK